jgi:hypothetical protein
VLRLQIGAHDEKEEQRRESDGPHDDEENRQSLHLRFHMEVRQDERREQERNCQ